jgi:hypothetical protein
MKTVHSRFIAGFLLAAIMAHGEPVPKTYDDAETATWHVPLANAKVSPSFLTSSYFYAREVRPIFRSYPIYHPDKEPEGYLEQLMTAEPEVLWDDKGIRPSLNTEEDWIRAGEVAYEAPIWPRPLEEMSHYRDSEWIERMGLPVAADGTIPGVYYTVQERGAVGVGIFSCATCHNRVDGEGQIFKAAQGNLPLARIEAFEFRKGLHGSEEEVRDYEYQYHGTPWIKEGPNTRLLEMTLEEHAATRDAIPPGVYPNHNGSMFSPAKIADLIGLKQRRYMDFTGHMRLRGPSDVMRFTDFHQSGSNYASFGPYQPQTIPDPEDEERYSDEQAYALTLYLYSLETPISPHKVDALALRGKAIFKEEGCVKCHAPKTGYTNHKLTAVDGYKVPNNHPEQESISRKRVHTDPTYGLMTRKGTGLYKIPSLIGLWNRGPYEHNGSCATLGDWFDSRRLDDDYVPTGWKGPPGTKTRAVPGHEFGLDLSEENKKALIAFLLTL